MKRKAGEVGHPLIRGPQRTLGDFGSTDTTATEGSPGTLVPILRAQAPGGSAEAWEAAVESFVATWRRQRSIGERWERGLRYILRRIRALLDCSPGCPSFSSPSEMTELHVMMLRTRPEWGRATTQFYFAGLRQFLRWSGNPISERSELWRLPPGSSTRRRWLAVDDLVRLYRAARGASRLIVALEGFNGLRRIEVLRLRAQDVNLAEGWLNVRGKGRMGGKWRQIPLGNIARNELNARMANLGPDVRILPFSASWADVELAKAARAAGFTSQGIRVSHHDLRRTFGRVAYESGMDLVQLKNLFGHSNLDMSVHYIGLDLDRMREGLGHLDRAVGQLVAKTKPPMKATSGRPHTSRNSTVAPSTRKAPQIPPSTLSSGKT